MLCQTYCTITARLRRRAREVHTTGRYRGSPISHRRCTGGDRSVPLLPIESSAAQRLSNPPQASLPSPVLVSRPADRSLSLILPLSPTSISHTVPSLARPAFAFASRQRHCRRSWASSAVSVRLFLPPASKYSGYGPSPTSTLAVRLRAVSELPLEVIPSWGETWACVALCTPAHTADSSSQSRTLHSRTSQQARRPPFGPVEGIICCVAAAAVPIGLLTSFITTASIWCQKSRQKAPP